MTTENRKQHIGIGQGCPPSPYSFVSLLTIMMEDTTDDTTVIDKQILHRGKRHHEITKNCCFSNAHDTIIMTSTADAAQLILRKIQQ